jgi:hypothetical protein
VFFFSLWEVCSVCASACIILFTVKGQANKTLAESRVPVGELPGGVITMHVVVRPPSSDKNSEKQLTNAPKKNRCSCTISMNVHTKMYNFEGNVKDFLPAGQTQLPSLYFCFFVLYAFFLGVWIYEGHGA